MKYLKLFESIGKKKLQKIEDKLQEIINLNNIDIDIDYIKDMSASATDIFIGNKIEYNEYIDIGEDYNYGFESWPLYGYERDSMNDGDYGNLLKFYKNLLSTKKTCYLTFEVYIVLSTHVSLKSNPNIDLFKEELKDIKSKCEGENILFHDNISSAKSSTENFITLNFHKRLNIPKGFDDRILISNNLIKDFDAFITTYNISKDAESDLIKLIVKAQESLP
jgi:hypothetical protein